MESKKKTPTQKYIDQSATKAAKEAIKGAGTGATVSGCNITTNINADFGPITEILNSLAQAAEANADAIESISITARKTLELTNVNGYGINMTGVTPGLDWSVEDES